MRKMSSERRAHSPMQNGPNRRDAFPVKSCGRRTVYNRFKRPSPAADGAAPSRRFGDAAVTNHCSDPTLLFRTSRAATGIAATLTAGRSAPSCWADPDFHRRFLEALSGRTQMRTQS